MGFLLELFKKSPGKALGEVSLSRRRKFVALAVAGAVDLCQIVLLPFFFQGAASPFDWVLDLGAVAVLTAILGFKWRLALALVVELVPGLDLFPTWTALMLSLPSSPAAERGVIDVENLNNPKPGGPPSSAS